MREDRFVAMALVGAVLLSMPGAGAKLVAQAQAKKAAPKPAASEAEEVRAGWNEIGRKIITMAGDMPEASYDYKPAADVRSFRGVLLHVAGSNYYFIHPVAGQKMGDDANDPEPTKYKTKAAVVAYLKKSFEDGAAVMEQQGETGMKKEVRNEFTNQMMHVRAWWYMGVGHSAEHYGNLVTYYRVNKMAPPESRPQK